MTTRRVGTILALPLLAATAWCVAAGPSDAPTSDPRRYDARAAFDEADRNGDGVIDHEEFQERMTEVFFFADRNKDGWLDATELRTLVFPDDFTADDKDADGRVSLREFMRVRFRDFRTADRNGDEVLSVDEVVATYEGKRPR